MRSLLTIIAILALTACTEDTRQPLYPKTGNLNIRTLKGDYDAKGLSTVCVDGITYLVTEQGGITPKFQSWADVDPTVEECE